MNLSIISIIFLRTEGKVSDNNLHIRVVKTLGQIVRTTLYRGWIDKDPFVLQVKDGEKKSIFDYGS
jgi:hypothetical protein